VADAGQVLDGEVCHQLAAGQVQHVQHAAAERQVLDRTVRDLLQHQRQLAIELVFH